MPWFESVVSGDDREVKVDEWQGRPRLLVRFEEGTLTRFAGLLNLSIALAPDDAENLARDLLTYAREARDR